MNNLSYHAPRKLVIFLHGGAGIKGSPDDRKIVPMDRWGFDADYYSLDYPLGHVRGMALWVTFLAINKLMNKHNPTETVVIGMSHGGWLAARLTAHYTKHPVLNMRVPDKLVMLYAPVDFTQVGDFMRLPHNVYGMYNFFFTGSYEDSEQSVQKRKNASLPGLDYGNCRIVTFHGYDDEVVAYRQVYLMTSVERRHVLQDKNHGFSPFDDQYVLENIRQFVDSV
jgi:predicted esterase YcpF (UPF0227 family)